MSSEGSQTPPRRPAGFRAAVRRHPWRTAAVVAGSLLTVALAALFNADLQKSWLLPRLLPLAQDAGVDRLDVDYLHLTPWSLRLRGVAVDFRGLTVAVPEAAVTFNPFGLLTDTVVIHELRVPRASVDLTQFRAGPPGTTPFAGVLSTLEHGVGVALYDVDVGAEVQLDAARRLTARVRGDGVRPHVPGTLDLQVRYDDGAQQLELAGPLTLDQLSRGRFRRIALEGDVTLQSPDLPAAERLAVALSIAPAPGAGHARALIRERRQRGEASPPAPEALALTLRSTDAAGAQRAQFTFDGRYRGVDGSLRGQYTLQAGDALVTPYPAGQPLPRIAMDVSGELGVETMSGAIDVTATATTRLSKLETVLGANAALPEKLDLHSAVTLALHGQRLAVSRFEHSLTGDVSASPLAALHLQAPVVIPLDAPQSLLDTPRGLGTLILQAVPVPWVNGLLDGLTLEGGALSGNFELLIADERRLQLLPLQPLRVGDVAVKQGEQVMVPALRVTASPRLTKSDERLRVRIVDLTVADGEHRLLGGNVSLLQPLVANPPAGAPDGPPDATPRGTPPLRLSYALKADIDALRALPPLAARRAEWPLPDGLALAARGDVDADGARLTIATLEATLGQTERPELLRLVARQPFALPAEGAPLENPRGELASLTFKSVDLAWVAAFVPDLDLTGTLAAADLLLTAPAPDRFAVRATAPLRIEGLGARLADAAQVVALDVTVVPAVDYAPDAVGFDLSALKITSRGKVLVQGRLAGGVPLAQESRRPLGAEGRLELDLTSLAAQPAVRRALDRRPPDLALDSRVDFAATMAGDTVRIGRLKLDLRAGAEARMSLAAEDGLELRPTLRRDERLARHVVGKLSLSIRDLSSAVIERLVALEGVDFADFDADLRLSSDGAVLRADSAAPLHVERVSLTGKDGALLEPFSFGTRAAATIQGRQLSMDLADVALEFAGQAEPALSGRVAATIEPDRTVPLTTLDTALTAQLPQWLSQPVVMPGHKLTAGALTAKIAVTPDGAIAANATLDGLAARAPLALSHIELPVTGRMAPDGRGFSFTAPLSANGKSGTSNAAIDARYAPEPGEQGLLRIRLDSALFYLNDLLATLSAVAPAAPAAAGTSAESAPTGPVALDRSRDAKAAWDVLPYGTALEYRIDKLFYTDYLAFDEVTGQLAVRRRKIQASEVAARFHDSPLRLNGTLSYREQAAEPYLLDVDGTVKDFDLNQFFKELVPGEKPRIKGLFSVKLEADGEMPNLSQLRNETLFDIRMKSRKGVFRPLPPSSTLLVGTSDMLGLVGEGLSYMPTGGFGAGTIARLVNYITRIDYELVDIRVRRAESRDIVIERFLVRSPTIAMTATGGITHAAGKDVLDSPLDLRANLDMSGRGAAILYSMGLLRNEKNEAGYWRGPEFKIWGTPSASESNFADIIRQASDGTVKGGITRPLAGLIGNLKYRWFGDEPDPLPPELAAEVEALEAETMPPKSAP